MSSKPPTETPPKDGTQELYETWLQELGRMSKPRFFSFLLERAGVDLDRALFPLLVRIGVRERIGVSELAELVGSDHSTVSRQLHRLEQLRFIKRTRAEHDARVREAEITSTGRHVVEEINRARRTLLEEALADWSEADKHRLAVLQDRFNADVHAYVDAHMSDPPR